MIATICSNRRQEVAIFVSSSQQLPSVSCYQLELSAHAHAEEELDVVASFLQLVEHQFHGFDGRDAGQCATQNDDLIVFVGMVEEFLFARAGEFHVDGREDAAVDKMAVEVDLHVAGALEFFENDFVHA